MIQHNNIQLNVTAPKLNQTIVPFINMFGRLWYGQLTPELFVKKFNSTKKDLLFALTNLDQSQTHNRNNFLNLSFQLDLLHATRNVKQWNFPCLINQYDNELDWTTGNKRLLATGMNRATPWNHLNVLALTDHDICDFLIDPESVESDSQLEKILNFSGPIQLDTEMINGQSGLKIKLSYLGGILTPKENKHSALKKFSQWQQKYGKHPILEITTSWPEMITDSANAWNIKIVDNSETIKKGIFRPGHLENNLRKEHARGVLPTQGHHRLLIVEPRPIDVSELLCWMNLEQNIFIDHNWQFLLHRPDSMFENTFIGLSEIAVT
jgi:hypothetical protein